MHTTSPQPPNARRGFTLVELLVAAALCVIIMYAIATAFKAGTDILSQLRSLASLAEQERTADTIMRRDLKAYHLENDDAGFTGVRVSAMDGSVNFPSPWTKKGFFKVAVSTVGSEGADGSGIASYRATGDWLHFTTRLSDLDANALQTTTYAATAPAAFVADSANLASLDGTGQRFVSRWAEIAYYLSPAASNPQTPPDAGPVQNLYVLHRRYRVLAPPTGLLNALPLETAIPNWNTKYPEMALFLSGLNVSIRGPGGGTSGVTDPANRMFADGMTRTFNPINPVNPTYAEFTSADPQYGSDILLTNVLSMKIQVLCDNAIDYTDLPDPDGPLPGGPGGLNNYFDTFNNTMASGAPVRLRAVRITLRVYDPKNKLTRQITIAQAL